MWKSVEKRDAQKTVKMPAEHVRRILNILDRKKDVEGISEVTNHLETLLSRKTGSKRK